MKHNVYQIFLGSTVPVMVWLGRPVSHGACMMTVVFRRNGLQGDVETAILKL
jgi:hypothetical protein